MSAIESVVCRLAKTVEESQHHQLHPQRSQPMLSKIERVLKEFKTLNLAECDWTHRDQAVKLLQVLSRQFTPYAGSSHGKMGRIHEKIVKLEAKLAAFSSVGQPGGRIKELQQQYSQRSSSQAPPFKKIDMTIAYFCDMDSPDDNRVIQYDVLDAYRTHLPFIVSPSLLATTGKVDQSWLSQERFFDELVQYQDQWDIFAQTDSQGAHQMFVFVPKNMQSEKSEVERLDALDLKSDGTLKKISLSDIPTESVEKGSVDAFQLCFKDNPEKNKLIYLAGHGGVGSPGGMSQDHFKEWLKVIESQKCQGLAITSCNSGGESSLLFIPDSEEARRGVLFPVMIQSLGDFPTRAVHGIDAQMTPRLEMMKVLLEKPGTANVRTWQKALKMVEKGEKKDSRNNVQLYFPQSMASPAGVRSTNEVAGFYSLTMHELGKKKMDALAQHSHEVVLKEMNHLQVYPLVVESPLVFEGANPILISQVPGPSHHFFHKIVLDEAVLEKETGWFDSLATLHEDVSVPKAFFIGTLQLGKDAVHDVVAGFGFENRGKVKTAFYFRKGDDYFCYKKQPVFEGSRFKEFRLEKISSVDYFLAVEEIQTQTIPSRRAARAATAGQQDETLFHQALQGVSFSPENMRIAEIQRLQTMEEGDVDGLANLLRTLNDEERGKFMFYLTKHAKDDCLVALMYKNIPIRLDSVGGQKASLLNQAITSGKIKFVQTLLAAGADPDGGAPAPLVLALSNQNTEMLKVLLENHADVFKQDAMGIVPFIKYMRKGNREQIAELLNRTQVVMNVYDSLGDSALGCALESDDRALLQHVINQLAGFHESPSSNYFYLIKSLKKSVRKHGLEDVAFVLQRNPPDWLKGLIFDAVVVENPEDAHLLLERQWISPNCIVMGERSHMKVTTVFGKICELSHEDPERYRKLMVLAIEQGADLSVEMSQASSSSLIYSKFYTIEEVMASLRERPDLNLVQFLTESEFSSLLGNFLFTMDLETFKRLMHQRMPHPMLSAEFLEQLFLDKEGLLVVLQSQDEFVRSLMKIAEEGNVEVFKKLVDTRTALFPFQVNMHFVNFLFEKNLGVLLLFCAEKGVILLSEENKKTLFDKVLRSGNATHLRWMEVLDFLPETISMPLRSVIFIGYKKAPLDSDKTAYLQTLGNLGILASLSPSEKRLLASSIKRISLTDAEMIPT